MAKKTYVADESGSPRASRQISLGCECKEVHICIHVTSISDISTVHNSFTSDFFVILHWQASDARLKAIRAVETMARVSGDASDLVSFWAASNVFKPNLELVNATSFQLMNTQDEIRMHPRIDDDVPGYVKKTLRYVAKFRTHFDLHSFPFDSQTIEMHYKLRRFMQTNIIISRADLVIILGSCKQM